MRFALFVRDRTFVGGFWLSHDPETRGEKYRERAIVMLKLAHGASSEQVRILYLQLAEMWNHLAERAKKPKE